MCLAINTQRYMALSHGGQMVDESARRGDGRRLRFSAPSGSCERLTISTPNLAESVSPSPRALLTGICVQKSQDSTSQGSHFARRELMAMTNSLAQEGG